MPARSQFRKVSGKRFRELMLESFYRSILDEARHIYKRERRRVYRSDDLPYVGSDIRSELLVAEALTRRQDEVFVDSARLWMLNP